MYFSFIRCILRGAFYKKGKKMIRVLQIVTYMGRGGLETMLMNYYRCMDRSKVQFDFLVHRDFEADYDEEILAMGGRIYHMSRLIPWSGAYRKKLKNFFREHPEYRIIHVHQDCLSSVALQCAKECGIPVRIAHSHNKNQDINIKYWIKKRYMKQIPKFATDYFACGKDAGDWMFSGHSYHILRNAIDVSAYTYSPKKATHIREQLNVENKFVIGHIGRFDPQKNHSFLIDIFYNCAKSDRDARLLLIGDGKGRIRIQEKVKSLGLEEKVIFTGVRSDIADLLQAIDVFVFPSVYEGLGIAAVEAQAAGVPCVLSDNVPSECKMTKNVEYLSLKESPEVWARHIIACKHIPHTDTYEDICKAGYDINENATKLQNFYCNGVFDE